MVAPMLEVLLLRLLRRRAASALVVAPTRLVSTARPVESLGLVLDGTTVLLARGGAPVEVLPAGSVVWPPFWGRPATSYAVLTHAPVDLWLRIGPLEARDGRSVQQVELRLRVTLTDSAAGLADLLEADALVRGRSAGSGRATAGATSIEDPLEGFGDRLLDRLADAVAARTADAVHRRTIDELADLSLKIVLDEALPSTFLDGSITRRALEVLDVDWPTEGRGWPHAAVAAALGLPGAQVR